MKGREGEDKSVISLRSLICFCVAFFVLIHSDGALAEESVKKLPVKRLAFNEAGRLIPFQSKPAKALMPPQTYERYNTLLKDLDCDTANDLLVQAFFKAYPQFARFERKFSIVNNPTCSGECADWVIFISRRFYELSLCMVVRKFEDSQQILKRRPGAVPKYAPLPMTLSEANEHPIINDRDAGLDNIAGFSDLGYLPATLKVIEIMERGGVFDVGSDAEYFALMRARKQGADYDRFRRRAADLKAKLGDERAEIIRKEAYSDHLDRPRLNDLLLGKKKF